MHFRDVISHHEVGRVPMDIQHKRHVPCKRTPLRITTLDALKIIPRASDLY